MSHATLTQNRINHIALVLDASVSMNHLREQVIKVADEQIQWLAERSKRMDQETRITVYSFGSTVQCLVYDKDVLRLPSLRDLYRIDGNTALIDAVMQSQNDLAETPERYGEHSFLTFVITDGEENWSRRFTGRDLAKKLADLPAHWTVAVMVPGQREKISAMDVGFAPENIAIWDASSKKGVEEAGRTIRAATDTFMDNRAKGIRGSRSVFSTGADAVNAQTIQQADLKPLPVTDYMLVPVTTTTPIKEWVEAQCGIPYRLGKSFYQLTKRELIQGNKQIMILEKATNQVYAGNDVRNLLGLGRDNVQVKPDHNDKYEIFVMSTSVNRKLLPGTKLLVLN